MLIVLSIIVGYVLSMMVLFDSDELWGTDIARWTTGAATTLSGSKPAPHRQAAPICSARGTCPRNRAAPSGCTRAPRSRSTWGRPPARGLSPLRSKRSPESTLCSTSPCSSRTPFVLRSSARNAACRYILKSNGSEYHTISPAIDTSSYFGSSLSQTIGFHVGSRLSGTSSIPWASLRTRLAVAWVLLIFTA